MIDKKYNLRHAIEHDIVVHQLREALKVHLTVSEMTKLKLEVGSPCYIQTDVMFPARAYPSNSKQKQSDNEIKVSRFFRELHGLSSADDKVSISKDIFPIAEAYSIYVFAVPLPDDASVTLSKPPPHKAIKNLLSKVEYLTVGMELEGVDEDNQRFKITQIDDSTAPTSIFKFGLESEIFITERHPTLQKSLELTKEGIGGLTRQLDELNKRLRDYEERVQNYRFECPIDYVGGVLLYGLPGTGKTLILDKVAQVGWKKVFRVTDENLSEIGPDKAKSLMKVFDEARKFQPSLIVIDELDSMVGSATDSRTYPAMGNFTKSLIKRLKSLKSMKTLVIAATTNLRDLDPALLREGAFGQHIEIPIPHAVARTEILKLRLGRPLDTKDQMLDDLGQRTHGYVGNDLRKLIRVALVKAKDRLELATPKTNDNESLVKRATADDFASALNEIKPTVMQEIFFEKPNVHWEDIGGQHALKKELQNAIGFHRKNPAVVARLRPRQTRGILLYGPPGCSKTLTAKAMATDSDLNFLPVKGAEFLSMYVGESERKLRELFEKARRASPSIIFFDEIEAIATSRGSEGGNNGVHLLTTLLNELDGIEILKDVFVLAATNKPEAIDTALLRPGRFDRLLYVGPPDMETRIEILKIESGKTDVEDGVDLEAVATETEGYSGAEIVGMFQEAVKEASEQAAVIEGIDGKTKVGMRHLEKALKGATRHITLEVLEKLKQWENKGKIL